VQPPKEDAWPRRRTATRESDIVLPPASAAALAASALSVVWRPVSKSVGPACVVVVANELGDASMQIVEANGLPVEHEER